MSRVRVFLMSTGEGGGTQTHVANAVHLGHSHNCIKMGDSCSLASLPRRGLVLNTRLDKESILNTPAFAAISFETIYEMYVPYRNVPHDVWIILRFKSQD